MRFEAPGYWLLMPPLLAYLLWFAWRGYAHLSKAGRVGSLALRAAMLTLLIAALTRPDLARAVHRRQLVFVVDVSQSISPENLDAALEDVDRLVKEASAAPLRPDVSVVAFGRRPRLVLSTKTAWTGWPPELRELLGYRRTLGELRLRRTQLVASTNGDPEALAEVEAKVERVEAFRDEVAGDFTDVRSALHLALACGDSAAARAVYLFTDANFNYGDGLAALAGADAAAASLHVVALDRPLPDEVAAVSLQAPSSLKIHQTFTARLRLASTLDVEARVQVYKDGFALPSRSALLRTGETALDIEELHFQEKGFHLLEAVIRSPADTQLENNTVAALVNVPGPARVLYIDRDESQSVYLKTALELEGMNVEVRPAAGVPRELSDLLSFDALILSNVPADRLTPAQMQMVRGYVQDFGGGFVMLGGDESFGLGGYFATPIEEVLPVRMPIQKDLTRPSLAIMLVIDKSGSMEGLKIQLGKRAALATSEAIHPRDQIGVVGFDGQSRVILELTSASDRQSVASGIAQLEAGGGTFLYPALEDARDRLQGSNARRKHVVVLSDGQTQGFGYEELVQLMAADGITLSAVGIGEGADMNLMEAIALSGGGRAYFTNDFYTIPQIFTREALRASNNMLVERLVAPVVISEHPCLRDIDGEELPLLTGYVATTPKPAANVLIVSDSGDPLLATWRCGLGRTVAFTSETKPRWAEDWLAWDNFAKFFGQVVRSVTQADLGEAVSITASHMMTDNGARLTADIRDQHDDFAPAATVDLLTVDEHGRARSLAVEQTGPGVFETDAEGFQFGRPRQFVWTCTLPGQEPQHRPHGFIESFSPEFRTLGPGLAALEQIRRTNPAGVETVGRTPLVLPTGAGVARVELWPWLLTAALLLAPIDILIRRLG